MGSDFTNIQVRGSSASLVASAIRKVSAGRAKLSASTGGWVTVLDETSETRGDDHVRRLTKDLSTELQALAMSIRVYDGSVFEYRLYRCGRLLDEYSSNPGYLGEAKPQAWQRTRGKPVLLMECAKAGATPEKIGSVLDRKRSVVFQDQRVVELARLLAIPPVRAVSSFKGCSRAGWKLVVGREDPVLGEQLFAAVESGDAGQVKILLVEGAPTGARDRYGRSVLARAAELGESGMVETLLRAGARDSGALLAPGSIATARKLVEGGADVNAKADDGRTPLWAAVRSGRADLARVLLAAGADAKQSCDIRFDAPPRTERGRTLLMYSPNADVTKILVKAGCDVNERDPQGWTALMHASRWGRVDVVAELLDAGADRLAVEAMGHSAEDFAREFRRDKVLALLASEGSPGAGRVGRKGMKSKLRVSPSSARRKP